MFRSVQCCVLRVSAGRVAFTLPQVTRSRSFSAWSSRRGTTASPIACRAITTDRAYTGSAVLTNNKTMIWSPANYCCWYIKFIDCKVTATTVPTTVIFNARPSEYKLIQHIYYCCSRIAIEFRASSDIWARTYSSTPTARQQQRRPAAAVSTTLHMYW